jgi:hypothetical protein
MLLNVSAVLEAEKQLPPEAKRNSGPKNEFGIYKKSCSPCAHFSFTFLPAALNAIF